MKLNMNKIIVAWMCIVTLTIPTNSLHAATHNNCKEKLNPQNITYEKAKNITKSLKLTKEKYKKVKYDIEDLVALGIGDSVESIDSIDFDDDSISYTLSMQDYVNEITIPTKFNHGNLFEMTVEQGSIHNEITIDSNGGLSVDGFAFDFADGIDCSDIIPDTNSAEWTKTCPYGTASSYQYFYKSGGNKNVTLSKNIKGIALATFLLILSKALLTLPIFATSGLIFDGASLGLGAVYSLFVNKYPETDAVSIRGWAYTRKSNNSYINSTVGYVVKYNFKCYPHANYVGTPENKTWYYHNWHESIT